MIATGVDPHRFSLAGSFEAMLCVEFDGTTICDEHMLMKPLISNLESFQNCPADSRTLELWEDDQMGIVDHKVPV